MQIQGKGLTKLVFQHTQDLLIVGQGKAGLSVALIGPGWMHINFCPGRGAGPVHGRLSTDIMNLAVQFWLLYLLPLPQPQGSRPKYNQSPIKLWSRVLAQGSDLTKFCLVNQIIWYLVFSGKLRKGIVLWWESLYARAGGTKSQSSQINACYNLMKGPEFLLFSSQPVLCFHCKSMLSPTFLRYLGL